MGWHAEAQSGRGVLGELRGESARVRRLSRTVARSSPILWARRGKWVTDAVMPLKRLTCGPGVLESTTVRNIRRFAKEAIDFMAELLEAIMLICFGLSWPLNAYKNYRAGTAVGDQLQFIALITAGYFAGTRPSSFPQPQLGADRLLHQRGVHCRQLARLLPQSPPGRAALNRGGHGGRVFRRGGLGCHCPLLLVERHLLYP